MTKNDFGRTIGRMAVAMVLLVAGLAVVAAPASAHPCTANSHEGCNGHYCPDDGDYHSHYTAHPWWWDHYCESGEPEADLSKLVDGKIVAETPLR